MKKKILIYFFTGKRGGFSHYIPIINRLKKEKKINYKILASDMHLSNYFGETINEIKQYSNKVLTLPKAKIRDSIENRLSVVSNTIKSLSKIFEKRKPNFLIVLGDRAEVLGASISAMHFNIPLIHMYGGDVTQGGTDEPTRHSITKMANIHLTSNINSQNNVKKMGEESWRVFNVGLSSLDLFKNKLYKSRKYLEKKYGINLKKKFIILIQHPVTWQIKDSKKQINETLKSLKKLKIPTIAVYPCSDPGYENIVKAYKIFSRNKFFSVYKNIKNDDFYSLLNFCSLLIGNSSCGITECGFLKKYVINIGTRQKGRLSGKNVFHVDHDHKKIIQKMNKIFKLPKINKKVNIYGNGNSAARIIKLIKKFSKTKNLIEKKFVVNNI